MKIRSKPPPMITGMSDCLAEVARPVISSCRLRSFCSICSGVTRSAALSAIEATLRDATDEEGGDQPPDEHDDEVRHERPAVVEHVGLGLQHAQQTDQQEDETEGDEE